MNSSFPVILVNGRAVQQVSVLDRGLAYGHGLFETIRVNNGLPQLWQQHLARLKVGCERLFIQWPKDIEAKLTQEVAELCARSDALIKIIFTAGSGGLGYAIPEAQTPMRIVIRYPLPDYPLEYTTAGIAVCTCDYRLAQQTRLAGLKHLNRLDQVLASAEWRGSKYKEGIMLDQQDRVIEGTRSNLFAVDKNGDLLTPQLSRCGVMGVMRQYLIEQAALCHIKVLEGDYSSAQLKAMPELFVCNSLIGIWPIRQWDQHDYSVGEITRRLQLLVKKLFVIQS